MNQEKTDQEIIAVILAGDRDAFSVLIKRYQNLVFRIILRQTGLAHLAEDLAQEVFIKAFKGLKSFRAEAKFSTWLIQLTLNTLVNQRSSKSYKRALKTEFSDFSDRQAEQINAEEILKQKQTLSLFQDCYQKISDKLSQALLLVGLNGLSYEDAAQALKIPVGTVRSRLNQARLLISECMQKDL